MPGPVYNSIVEIPGDGVTTQHAFNFAGGYISRTHVKARIIAADGGITKITVTDGMFVGDFTLNIGVVTPIGSTLRIYRETPRAEPLANFAGGSRITEANLDLLTQQAIFGVAEAFDAGEYANVNDLLVQAGVSAATAVAAAAAADADAAAASASANDAVTAVATVGLPLTGAVGDGVTDDTTAVQAGINAAADLGVPLLLGPGVFRVTSTLTGTAGLSIQGAGCAPYTGSLGTRGGGSWLYFDHLNGGVVVDGVGSLSGVYLRGFGTIRNQPEPAAGEVAWTPTDHAYDFYLDNTDATIEDVMLLRSTRGIYVRASSNDGLGSYGRLDVRRLRGQVFMVGLHINEMFDVVKLSGVHFWPFWRDNTNIHKYTLANMDGVLFGRCDNPMLTDVFTIFARAGLHFTQVASGAVSKFHGVNLDFDRGTYGILVDASVTNTITGQVVNLTAQGETGAANSTGVALLGKANLDFVNVSLAHHQNQSMYVGGDSAVTVSGGVSLSDYNLSGSGFPGVEVATGAEVRITGPLRSVPTFGGAGVIEADAARSWAPGVSAPTGSVTAWTSVGTYRRVNRRVHFRVSLTITTNGTAAGGITFTLPVSCPLQTIAIGRETAVGGAGLTATCLGTTANILTTTNGHPATDGSVLVVSGSYDL